jgi:hypothetical protein
MRLPVKLFLKLKFNYTFEKAPKIDGPFLLLANHTTDLDPLMIGCSFNQHMYFVASEHLYRRGFLTKLLKWGFAPIARIKGSTDTVSAMTILRTLKRHQNVGLFAEGDRSWNGITGKIHPTTVRLIKASKAALVTYRISGGYLTTPRWSAFMRRGKMNGRCVGVYSTEQLQEMTDDEIQDIINTDIYEDAYEKQRVKAVAYCGKHLAEKLETAIYACPKCRRLCTLRSEDDTFFCECGLHVKYNEYGFFEGIEPPFETVTAWDIWQDQFLRAMAEAFGEGPIYKDQGQTLWEISDDHGERLVSEGTMALYKDRFVLGDYEVPLTKLYHMSLYGREMIVFSADGRNFEIRSAHSRSGRKYLTMFEILTSGEGAVRGAALNESSQSLP